MNQISHLSIICLLAVCFLAVGCDGTPDNVGLVEGTVMLNDAPLPGAMIEFVPQASEGRTSYATTDAEGHYVMIYYGETEGAELGVNTVRVTLPDPGDDSDKERVVIPAKYNTQSEETFEVLQGENTHDIKIEM
jgi:hypothetical protein